MLGKVGNGTWQLRLRKDDANAVTVTLAGWELSTGYSCK